MTSDEANEVLGIVQRCGPAVLSAAVDPTGNIGTALRRAVGLMVTDPNMINLPTFVVALSISLELARQSAATLVTMDRVRNAALAEVPISLPAVQTVLAIVRLALACEAQILAAMTFTSRDQVETIALSMNAAFDQTVEVAADDMDSGAYQALIHLQGDVVQHLADRGRLLPRVINYSYQVVMPVLRMAQWAYADPSRYQELIDENSVCHPGFCPQQGRMLAV
jgi:prophage DNA circulation protein